MMTSGDAPRRTWLLVACMIAGLAGLANMVVRIGGDPPNADFRLIWLAGRVVREGLNLYGPDFPREGLRLFGRWAAVHVWVYPPHFWPFSLLFSLPAYGPALVLWNAASIGFAIAAAALTACALRETRVDRLFWAAAIVALIGLSTASGSALLVAQTSFLILLGFGLLLYGLRRESPWMIAIGMAIVMLKPNIGLVLCGAVPFTRGGLRASLYGAAIVAALSLPILLLLGVKATIAGYLFNIGDYRAIIYNWPAAMTGVANLVFGLTGRNLPAMGTSLAAAVTAAALMIMYRMRNTDASASQTAWAYLPIAGGAALGIVELHIYDLVLAGPLMIATGRDRSVATRLLVAIGLLLIVRPENVAHVAGGLTSARVAAFGCLALLTAAIITVARPLPPLAPRPIS